MKNVKKSKTAIKKLKGINLGGWLLMEGYILGGRNIPEQEFKKEFKKKHGSVELAKFEKEFQGCFIQEADFKRIKALGANCVRVPFHYKVLEKNPFMYDKSSFVYFDKIVEWAKTYKLGVIFDLHAAPGSQNCDWHGDSTGHAYLWDQPHLRERTYRLWEVIADRYKDNDTVIGYDILNEAVVDKDKLKILKNFYSMTTKIIKAVDKKHTIFIEGNTWAQEIDFLEDLIEDRVSVSIHAYQPLDYTFQFVKGQKYPGLISGEKWNKKKIAKYLDKYHKFGQKNNVRILVGEYGVNYRLNAAGEVDYLRDLVSVFDDYDFDSTYWTYKAVPQNVFPDGVYRYLNNTCCVRREGPIFGWENYYYCWKKHHQDVINCWNTDNYKINKDVSKVLKEYFKKK